MPCQMWYRRDLFDDVIGICCQLRFTISAHFFRRYLPRFPEPLSPLDDRPRRDFDVSADRAAIAGLLHAPDDTVHEEHR